VPERPLPAISYDKQMSVLVRTHIYVVLLNIEDRHQKTPQTQLEQEKHQRQTFTVHHHDPTIRSRQPIPHTSHHPRNQCERRWMMVRPWIMPDPAIHLRIRVARPFGPELPDRPVGAMFRVQEFHEAVERVAVRALGVGCGWPGCGYYWRLKRMVSWYALFYIYI
jgi:hypothetical protein